MNHQCLMILLNQLINVDTSEGPLYLILLKIAADFKTKQYILYLKTDNDVSEIQTIIA